LNIWSHYCTGNITIHFLKPLVHVIGLCKKRQLKGGMSTFVFSVVLDSTWYVCTCIFLYWVNGNFSYKECSKLNYNPIQTLLVVAVSSLKEISDHEMIWRNNIWEFNFIHLSSSKTAVSCFLMRTEWASRITLQRWKNLMGPG
jgi:hypothetical protein